MSKSVSRSSLYITYWVVGCNSAEANGQETPRLVNKLAGCWTFPQLAYQFGSSLCHHAHKSFALTPFLARFTHRGGPRIVDCLLNWTFLRYRTLFGIVVSLCQWLDVFFKVLVCRWRKKVCNTLQCVASTALWNFAVPLTIPLHMSSNF